MILINQIKVRLPFDEKELKARAAKILSVKENEITSFEILRRSLDGRKKPELYYVYAVEIGLKDETRVLKAMKRNSRWKDQVSVSVREKYHFPEGVILKGELKKDERPVIVGAGPAGLFCAYYLALAGLKPIIFERGKCVEKRQGDVERFWETGVLDPNSNVQFGEGGAGTFSDGKLNTLVKDKDGRNRAILETFVKFGAKESILYDAKPHVGTDVLAVAVKNIRTELLRLGANIHFESQVTDFVIKDGSLTGIVVNDEERINCKRLVLAIGHSARDTFEKLLSHEIPMEAKPFAVGFRVEHPQNMINERQYGLLDWEGLEAAAYKVTAKASNGRGVYSFCMCPGGYVVNASSEEGRLAVNGMSYSRRDGKNANSAIIVSVTPEDYPEEGPLSGIAFQRGLEEKAYQLGGGKIPVQRYGEYRSKILNDDVDSNDMTAEVNMVNGHGDNGDAENEILPAAKGTFAWADLSGLLPRDCGIAFVEGMTQFARQIKGFDRVDAILSGVESRTSSPVRILRDEKLESSIKGIYPCGEGAGYAGGITSAAMDGLRVAEELVKRFIIDES